MSTLRFWQTRDRDAAKSYWDHRADQYRALIASRIRPLQPRTLLEIGCHSGPNLWALHQQLPAVELTGLDPSAEVVLFGVSLFEKEGISARWFVGAMPSWEGVRVRAGADGTLERSPGQKPLGDFDLILSVYTLAYLEADDLDETLSGCVEHAERAIVLAEPMVREPFDQAGPLPMATAATCPSWRHDYAEWFRVRAPLWNVTVKPFPDVQGMNGMLIATRP